MRYRNEQLDLDRFWLVFTDSDGVTHLETDQNVLTMYETIKKYLDAYDINSIELVAQRLNGNRVSIELASYCPF